MNIVKKLIIKIACLFKINLNYSGLRLETISLLKDIYQKKDGAAERKEAPDEEKYILCLGDSNTFGWNHLYKDSFPAMLGKKLNKNRSNEAVKVLNLGKGGSKIEDLDIDLLQFFRSRKNIIMVFNYGLNNVILDNIFKNYFYENKSSINWSGLSVEDFKDYLEKTANKYLKILKEFFEINIKIIVIGLYSVNSTRLGKKRVSAEYYLNLQNDILYFFNRKLKEIALQTGVHFIDLWEILSDTDTNREYLYKDGFHLNKKAYGIIAEKIDDILLK